MHNDMVISADLIQFSPHQIRLLTPDQSLLLSLSERVVTLFAETRKILAQGRFSDHAFRMFTVLLIASEGASYETLYAGLYCSGACLRRLLVATSLKVPEFQHEVAQRRAYLAALRDGALEAEIKQIRRAVKGSAGVADVLRTKGFGWMIQTIYGKGYVLVAESAGGENASSQQGKLADETARVHWLNRSGRK
jgi:hypothetical protein